MKPLPIIVIDTAEQAPLRFSSAVRLVRGSLWTGDYAIVAPDVPEYVTRRRKPTRKDSPPPAYPVLYAPDVAPAEMVATCTRAKRHGEDFSRCAVEEQEHVRLLLLPVRVERKRLGELAGMTVTRERERFAEREDAVLPRLARLGAGNAVIVVEGTLEDAYLGNYRAQTSPLSVVGSTIAWQQDYGVATIWAGNPGDAAQWVERYLTMALERHVEREKARAGIAAAQGAVDAARAGR